ncbi:MAG TPA: zinc ribbon domain-containing protein [Dehalococcoidia bacterium]|jgi:hypothetical protein
MLMAIWDDGTWQPAAAIAGVILGSYLIVMWVGALVWTYRDIRARTRDPFTHAIAVMVVLVFNLPGILLYMVLRPKETLAELYDRRLGSEALLHEIQEQETCPTCRRKIEQDFLACPYCRTALRVPCDNCAKPLHTTWVLCPFCGVDRSATPAPRPEPVPLPAEPRPRATASGARRASTATYTPPASATKPAPPAAADAAE